MQAEIKNTYPALTATMEIKGYKFGAISDKCIIFESIAASELGIPFVSVKLCHLTASIRENEILNSIKIPV